MNMLSPTGRSRMWDADADGYARGEGVAAIVLKRLSDALADGDHIECLIRETGTNQDGRTPGLTVPSSNAQEALIRQTYARAGLDLSKHSDRPHFFESHGTGTRAGDPREAAAIHQCFGRSEADAEPESGVDPALYVGSIKTVIGHTEGSAGLAGVLKGSLAIQNGLIPPNLLFRSLNPAIEPYYRGLKVPTSLMPWPTLPEGVPRRVSVNSFGFGGSNAHAILEEHQPAPADQPPSEPDAPLFSPFVFSAASDASLVALLQDHLTFLQTHSNVNARDLAWTLRSRRSKLPVKIAFSARTINKLVSKMSFRLSQAQLDPAVGIRAKPSAAPRVLGVFTGQGAQSPKMGAGLLRSSPFVRERIEQLEEALATLPDPPAWRLGAEMLAEAGTSRVAEAALSQPLCTALQIVLVDLVRAAGLALHAVVGHSSGEIAAAYAAGFLSDRDAMRVAYYRGLHAGLAGGARGGGQQGARGAMLAVPTSLEDARDLVRLRTFRGRLAIAAHNSPASVTLSGDADAVVLAKKVFDEEKKFARLLLVNTAYHSHHMAPCEDPYLASLRACGVRVQQPQSAPCAWFSSVFPSSRPVEPTEALQDVYWKDNMTRPVLFADALKNAVSAEPLLNLALEIGPHPALKGPAVQNISEARSEARSADLPYTGLLSRGQNDVEALSDALGFAWSHLGGQGVDFESFEKTVSGPSSHRPSLVVGLPSYPWNHARNHWCESRRSRKIRAPRQAFHELLGTPCPDSTPRDRRWSNILKPSEIPWLNMHQLQGQAVFPGAGYCVMALEGARIVAGDSPVELLELHDLSIPKAIAFDATANSSVEILVTLTAIAMADGLEKVMTADFSCYACSGSGANQEMDLVASAKVKIIFGTPSESVLLSVPVEQYNMSDVDPADFYSAMLGVGYDWTGPFATMSSIRRRLNYAYSTVSTYPYTDADPSRYLIHPSTLDVAFQSGFLAYSALGDGRIWALHVPTAIRTIRVNPALCAALPPSETRLPVAASLSERHKGICTSVDLFSEDSRHTLVQVEDITVVPFSPATAAEDRRLFFRAKWDVATPDGASVAQGSLPSEDEASLALAAERVALHFIRKWKAEISEEEWSKGQAHHRKLLAFIDHILDMVAKDEHPYVKKEWLSDGPDEASALIERHAESIDLRLLQAVGENMRAVVRGETTILEHILRDDMLNRYYREGLGFSQYNSFLARLTEQIVHRYPHARILEIGAGTGGATKSILGRSGNTMSSYTYTDISVGFFENAAELFRDYRDKMTFRVLDVEKSPAAQGFEAGSYDVVIASNVLHATTCLHDTLKNTRQLLRPGGYLLLLELACEGPIRSNVIVGGLPGWWAACETDRPWEPTMKPASWHRALRAAGFAGVDAQTPEIDGLAWPFFVMAAQAVDDRVAFLREPTAPSTGAVAASVPLQSIFVLGAAGSSRLAGEVAGLLAPFCEQVTILKGLPTVANARIIPPMSTFVNLVDLKAPIFNEDMTEERMDSLKRLFDLGRHILWVTAGALADEPYHMASIAFGRSISSEMRHVNLSFVDVDGNVPEPDVSRTIAEQLLRHVALDEWGIPQQHYKHRGPLLWSREPEVRLARDGQLHVPRMVPHAGQNARLNSARRTIVDTVSLACSTVSISSSADARPSLVEDVLAWPRQDGQQPFGVEISSFVALPVAGHAFLFLAVARPDPAADPVVMLTMTNASRAAPIVSTAVVAQAQVHSATAASSLLVAIASELLAAALLRAVPGRSSLVVHCSEHDSLLTAALRRRAATKAVRVTLTCSEHHSKDSSWIGVARMPKHAVRRMLLQAKPTHFVDFTTPLRGTYPGDAGRVIAQALAPKCRLVQIEDLYQHEALLPLPSGNHDMLARALEDAVSGARASLASTCCTLEHVQDLVVPFEQIHHTSRVEHLATVVDWASKDGRVQVQVQPLAAERLFSPDKTYLLVGLSGQLGQSLCEWMIRRGAGCVCLTSRHPEVDPAWLRTFAEGTVKVLAMDVTDKESLGCAVEDIRTTCPPIAGVANGAMVLRDSLFSSMSVDAMRAVLDPKVTGTNNLDELFHDDDLDFFVLFSSAAGVIGNSGQANYAAASGYLGSLARKRRARGLAASCFDIGRIVGVGYAASQASRVAIDQLTRFGVMGVSEADFHCMFAETVRIGRFREGDGEDAVLTTGIRSFCDDEELQGPWFDNPRFSHCTVEAASAAQPESEQGIRAVLPVREQLAKAATAEQALEAVQECLAAKLRVVLQISGQDLDYETSLSELGVDSLVAVEVRSWFLKEVKVDIPVLGIVGGASLVDLCRAALEKLPPELGGSAITPPSNLGAPRRPGHSSVRPPSIDLSTPMSATFDQCFSERGHKASTSSSSNFSFESLSSEAAKHAVASSEPTPVG